DEPLRRRRAAAAPRRERELPELEGTHRAPLRAEEGQPSEARGDADAPRGRPEPPRPGRQEPARPGGPATRQDLPRAAHARPPRSMMRSRADDEARYYTAHSQMTDPAERAPLLDALPADPARLVAAVSGLLLHPLFVTPLGIAPLDVTRPPDRRFIGICRDYALLACAALRHHRVPARLRVGFASYFTPGYLEDHW